MVLTGSNFTAENITTTSDTVTFDVGTISSDTEVTINWQA